MMNINLFYRFYNLKNLIFIFLFSGFYLCPSFGAEVLDFKGELEFLVKTNVPAISFSGKNKKDLLGKIQVDEKNPGQKSLNLKSFSFDPQNLTTEIELRDKHMHEKIFSDSEGKIVDVFFESKEFCETPKCDFSGTLSVAGVKSTQKFPVTIKEEGGKLQIIIETTLSLFNLGIKPPSYMGVKVSDEIPLKVKFVQN